MKNPLTAMFYNWSAQLTRSCSELWPHLHPTLDRMSSPQLVERLSKPESEIIFARMEDFLQNVESPGPEHGCAGAALKLQITTWIRYAVFIHVLNWLCVIKCDFVYDLCRDIQLISGPKVKESNSTVLNRIMDVSGKSDRAAESGSQQETMTEVAVRTRVLTLIEEFDDKVDSLYDATHALFILCFFESNRGWFCNNYMRITCDVVRRFSKILEAPPATLQASEDTVLVETLSRSESELLFALMDSWMSKLGYPAPQMNCSSYSPRISKAMVWLRRTVFLGFLTIVAKVTPDVLDILCAGIKLIANPVPIVMQEVPDPKVDGASGEKHTSDAYIAEIWDLYRTVMDS